MSGDETIGEKLVRIETKLDAALGKQTDHEARLRCVEKRIWLVSGGVVIAAWCAERVIPFLKP